MTYIVGTDITDRLIKDVVIHDDSYFDRADAALNDLAVELDVETADISDPIHYRVKEYLKAFVGYSVCEDLMGQSPQKLVEEGIQDDPYEVKLRHYKKVLPEKKALITEEILKDEADQPEEFASDEIELFRT